MGVVDEGEEETEQPEPALEEDIIRDMTTMKEEEEEEVEEEEEEDEDDDKSEMYCLPDMPEGIYSYMTSLHPMNSTVSLLLPGPLPWADTIVFDSVHAIEDETRMVCGNPTNMLSWPNPWPTAAEIIEVQYETNEIIMREEEDEEDCEDDDKMELVMGKKCRLVMPGDHPHALETEMQNPHPGLANKAIVDSLSSASGLQMTHTGLSSVHSLLQNETIRQDRKDSGVFMHDDKGFKKMATTTITTSTTNWDLEVGDYKSTGSSQGHKDDAMVPMMTEPLEHEDTTGLFWSSVRDQDDLARLSLNKTSVAISLSA
ncbi:hypothetical protein BGZ94_004721 [Podila epigama]|nr:hypothetical protein BGZ94_004721 [Podila epigama]